MLDCGLDWNALLKRPAPLYQQQVGKNQFLHQQQQEIYITVPQWDSLLIAHIDVVLISNALQLGALPLLVKHADFRAQIFATEPTIQLAKKQLEEMVHFEHVLMQQEPPTKKSKPSASRLFSLQDVEYCMSKMTPISFLQVLPLFENQLEAVAVSSGYMLGACNWIVRTKYEKWVYFSLSSSSSARHAEPLALELMKQADWAIVTQVNLENQGSADSMVNDLCRTIGQTLNAGGDVLIPCFATGLVYDLIEFVRMYLNSVNMHSVNMYMVSTVGDHSLAYSNICTEWVSENKQQQAYQAEPPFKHMNYLKNKQLQVFSTLQAFSSAYFMNRSTPSVIFAGHASLRFGEIINLIKMLDTNDKNAIIAVEPSFDFFSLTEPWIGKLTMKMIRSIVDVRLNPVEVLHLIKETKPRNLLTTVPIAKKLDDISKVKHETISSASMV